MGWSWRGKLGDLCTGPDDSHHHLPSSALGAFTSARIPSRQAHWLDLTHGFGLHLLMQFCHGSLITPKVLWHFPSKNHSKLSILEH